MNHHNLPMLSVVIVSFNTAALLYNCLQSLFAACEGMALEVIVVDNASRDGSVAMVRAEFPQARLIANRRNVGFGVANNQAVAVARAPYVMLLNSDTIVPPGAAERLLRELDRAPDLGLVGPRLIGADGKVQRSAFRFPTPRALLLEQINLARFLPAARQAHQPDETCARSVDWLIGACVLGRRDLLAALGPFDPRFFMYGEDIDLCYRLRRAGWDIRLAPCATITHLGGMSARRDRVRMALQATESMYLFYRKHYSERALLLAALIFRASAALKSLRDLVRLIWLTLASRDRERRAGVLMDLQVWQALLFLLPPALARQGDEPDGGAGDRAVAADEPGIDRSTLRQRVVGDDARAEV